MACKRSAAVLRTFHESGRMQRGRRRKDNVPCAGPLPYIRLHHSEYRRNRCILASNLEGVTTAPTPQPPGRTLAERRGVSGKWRNPADSGLEGGEEGGQHTTDGRVSKSGHYPWCGSSRPFLRSDRSAGRKGREGSTPSRPTEHKRLHPSAKEGVSFRVHLGC